jgi:hypothetical protein
MTQPVPPELMSPEDRHARLEWVQRQIGREWLRFAVLEAILIGIPLVAVVILFGTDTISRTTMLVLVVLLALADGAYTLYQVGRVKRLGRERMALEQYEALQ